MFFKGGALTVGLSAGALLLFTAWGQFAFSLAGVEGQKERPLGCAALLPQWLPFE